VSFGYDNANRRTSLTLPNGILVEYSYDAASRVMEITYKQNGTTLLGNLTYEYDKGGKRTKIGGSWARTAIPQNVASTNYDANNRQLTFGDKTLTYDNNGNLTSIADANGTTLYSWNARNQLAAISGPNVNVSFVYDGLGRREKKTVGGSLTEFLYDGVNPVQETSGATVLAKILSGLGVDEFLARTDVPVGTTSSFLSDALGSALALADSAGTVQTEYTYEPFGKTTATGVSNTNPFHFTGRENDGTGLYYQRMRYYNPQLQRFISEDPIEFASRDYNLYGYVGNAPLNFKDPLGLCKDECPGGRPKSFWDCFLNCLNDYDPANLVLGNLAGTLGGYLLTTTRIGGGYTIGTNIFRTFMNPVNAALAGGAARTVLGAGSGVLGALYGAIAAQCAIECANDQCSH
jgi:RHS repeat-associated protein